MMIWHLMIQVVVLALSFGVPHAAQASRRYEIGLGAGELTVVALGSVSSGWTITEDFEGLQSSLFARAFLVGDPQLKTELLFVVVESADGNNPIKHAVLQKLQKKYPGRFTEANFVLAGTHTHGAPATQNTDQPKVVKAVVDGIVDAVVAAVDDKAPGEITVSRGNLTTIARNRSEQAFDLNAEADRRVFPLKIDPLMTQLAFWRDGKPVGLLNFFGVHPTTMVDEGFTYISSDSYGYAAYRIESEMTRTAHGTRFVAAFAQTNAGDQTSNIHFDRCTDRTESSRHQWGCARGLSEHGPFESMKAVGEALADQAMALMTAKSSTPADGNGYAQVEQPARPVDDGVVIGAGGLNYRKGLADLASVRVAAKYTGGKEETTCAPAWGASHAAGSTEDLGTTLADEGADNSYSTAGYLIWALNGPSVVSEPVKTMLQVAGLGSFVNVPTSDELIDCQAPKEAVLALQPRPVGMQVFKLGKMHFAVVPFELTVMTGYRIRRHLAETLGVNVDDVLVLGYAAGEAPNTSDDDSGGGYIVTPEEYSSMQYEGGYTAWGKWSQPALAQALDRLAATLIGNAPPTRTILAPRPDDLLVKIADTPEDQLPRPTRWDGVPLFEQMGKVITSPAPTYPTVALEVSDKRRFVSAEFVSGHPMNRLRPGDSFAAVERRTADGKWEIIQRSGSWGLTIQWKAIPLWQCASISCLSAKVTWQIPDKVAPGTYRLVQTGDYRPAYGLSEIIPFRGETVPFEVVAQP